MGAAPFGVLGVKVLVTGAAGQLGREVVRAFSGREVIAADRTALDITDREAVLRLVAQRRPDVVVNTAAFTAVDRAEAEVELATSVNHHGVAHLHDAVETVGARLVQLSTDYVFSGTQARPYVESDRPDPRSVYGRTKLAGERAVGPGHLVIRTSWLNGRHGTNMARTILRLADEGRPLRFVNDQRGQPTFAADLAAAIVGLVDAGVEGLFHVTNQGVVTWFEFARTVLDLAGLDPNRVTAIGTHQLEPPRPAPRPANSVLDNAALRAAGLPLLRDHREPLGELPAAWGRA